MSKLQLPLMSLLAAIPGAFLTYLLVMAFLNNAEVISKSTVLLVFVSLTLLSSGFLAVFPVGALIFGPKGAGKKAKKSKDEPEMEADEDDFEEEGDDEMFVADSAAELSGEIREGEFDVIDEDEDDGMSFDEVDEFDDGDFEDAADSEFDFADDEYEFDEDEEEHKKK